MLALAVCNTITRLYSHYRIKKTITVVIPTKRQTCGASTTNFAFAYYICATSFMELDSAAMLGAWRGVDGMRRFNVVRLTRWNEQGIWKSRATTALQKSRHFKSY